jgi:sigma-B regulation protein RsbQ
MSIQARNNVRLSGSGPATMIFAHGFGCDQTMWRYLVPAFEDGFRIITYDLVGMGGSDWSRYDRNRYASAHGHAADLLEIIDAYALGQVVFVGHSLGTMIGLLATIKAPEKFAAQIMVSPSPSYVNDGTYIGGFNADDLERLLQTMDQDFLGWSLRVAPMIMRAPHRPELARELIRSFVRNDREIARHCARVTFLSDYRADLPHSVVPALLLQCSDDLLVPQEVGQYLQRHMPHAVLDVIDNVGHCPHLSAADASCRAINRFLGRGQGVNKNA